MQVDYMPFTEEQKAGQKTEDAHVNIYVCVTSDVNVVVHATCECLNKLVF